MRFERALLFLHHRLSSDAGLFELYPFFPGWPAAATGDASQTTLSGKCAAGGEQGRRNRYQTVGPSVIPRSRYPLGKHIDTRLDPSNGLLLYCRHDRLFHKGFVSFDDRLRVVVAPWVDQSSPPLPRILRQLARQQAALLSKGPSNRNTWPAIRSAVVLVRDANEVLSVSKVHSS